MASAGEGTQAAPPDQQTAFGRASRKAMAMGGVTVLLALLSGLVTFVILTGLTPIVPTHQVVVTALAFNGFLVLLLVALIGFEVVRLVLARRRGIAGARLHGRIVGLFALVAAVPAIIVAVVASVTLDRGLDRWFEGRTREIVDSSGQVARAYMQDHARNIGADLSVISRLLEQGKSLYDTDKTRFDDLVRSQMALRGLDGVYVMRTDYSLITRLVAKEGDKFLVPPETAIDKASTGESVILMPTPDDKSEQISALARLDGYDDTFLYIVRRLDPEVMTHLRRTAFALIEYKELEQRRLGVQVAFGLMYLGVSLILLLSAVWIGFWFANRLVAPIRRLIGAARLVSEGNLDVVVPVKASEGELASLGQTFNGMTSQLRTQRDDLLDVNLKLDTRRRFSEAVLSGVTAGVIGLDERGNVDLVNRSAEEILDVTAAQIIGMPIKHAVPEVAQFLENAVRRNQRLISGQLEFRRGGRERVVTVRVTTEEAGPAGRGYVVTLDDITELVTAQRTSAWADVARRIAHEIKNPLTPIQLSAERLKRKYGKVITADREVFEQCTDTIIRQVGDIGRMVDEFSAFARMPTAIMEQENLAAVVRDAAFLMTVSRPDLRIAVNVPEGGVTCVCDRRLISQAVTNLVKNASEAIATASMTNGEEPWIEVALTTGDGKARITVTDNGCGLPKENRRRLLEPYMTTREKGTGLGLAIVRKIVEDHEGRITLGDAPQVAEGGHGARVTLEFPLLRKASGLEQKYTQSKGAADKPKADAEKPAEAVTT